MSQRRFYPSIPVDVYRLTTQNDRLADFVFNSNNSKRQVNYNETCSMDTLRSIDFPITATRKYLSPSKQTPKEVVKTSVKVQTTEKKDVNIQVDNKKNNFTQCYYCSDDLNVLTTEPCEIIECPKRRNSDEKVVNSSNKSSEIILNSEYMISAVDIETSKPNYFKNMLTNTLKTLKSVKNQLIILLLLFVLLFYYIMYVIIFCWILGKCQRKKN